MEWNCQAYLKIQPRIFWAHKSMDLIQAKFDLGLIYNIFKGSKIFLQNVL